MQLTRSILSLIFALAIPIAALPVTNEADAAAVDKREAQSFSRKGDGFDFESNTVVSHDGPAIANSYAEAHSG